MQGTVVKIDAAQITDWRTFHAVFARELDFPAFYGANMDAWIDCMTDIDDPDAGMSTVNVKTGELAVLEISDARSFKERCPEPYEALVDCAAFVNHRRVQVGEPPVLALLLIG